jgi:vancomycin resistance protein YoaR
LRRHRRRRWALGALLLALVALCALAAALESGVDLFGHVDVGGVTVTRDREGAARLAEHAARFKQAEVAIHVGPYVARATRAALGVQLAPDVEARLLGLGQTGNPVRDLGDLWTARRTGLKLPWRIEIARDALRACVEDMRRKLERPPVPGALLADGSLLPGTPGLTINLLRVTDQLARGLSAGALDVTVDALRIAPPDPVRYVSGQFNAGQFSEVLSQFETKYRTFGASAGRARNIELAVQAIDGAVLEPGGELSFNEKVGERSYERGFETAKEIANRRVVDGVGGGVCQVAATLHAAAFLAGFDLPEYRPHSRPSRYIETGLDTMVAWPSQDLRIANVYPFPVRLRLRAEDGTLTVRLEGSGKAHPVEWSKEIVQRIAPGEQRIVDRTLATGSTQLVQEPIDGLILHRRRTIYLPTGPKVEDVTLRYPPNDRIVAVGDGGTRTTDERTANRALEMNDF